MCDNTPSVHHGVLRCGSAALVTEKTVAYVEADQCVVAGSITTSHFWPIRILVILFRLVIPESSGDPEGVNSLRELFYTSTNVNNSRYYYYYFHPRVDPESGTAGIFIHTAVNIRSVTPDQSLMRMRVGSRNSVSRLPFLRVKFFGSPSEVTLTPSPKSRF